MFPNYRKLLLKLRRAITLEKEVGIQRAQEWVDSCLSVLKEDYLLKDKMLRVTFDTLLTSRLLDPPESFVEKGSSDEEEEEGEGEEGSDDSSSEESDENEEDVDSDGESLA